VFCFLSYFASIDLPLAVQTKQEKTASVHILLPHPLTSYRGVILRKTLSFKSHATVPFYLECRFAYASSSSHYFIFNFFLIHNFLFHYFLFHSFLSIISSLFTSSSPFLYPPPTSITSSSIIPFHNFLFHYFLSFLASPPLPLTLQIFWGAV
jgi:hypothetical protein